MAARHRGLLVTGLVAFHLFQFLGRESDLWFPALGLGIVLISWFGPWLTAVLTLDILVIRLGSVTTGGVVPALGESALLGFEMLGAWWIYDGAARGSRWLEDPRSAVLFLLLIPGAVDGTAAALQAAVGTSLPPHLVDAGFGVRFGVLWLGRVLAVTSIVPFAWAVLTSLLQDYRLLPNPKLKPLHLRGWTWGESIELAGLSLGNSILAIIQVHLHERGATSALTLWGIGLLIVVWSALRQGLRGGTTVSLAGAAVALVLGSTHGLGPTDFSPLQGNLLAQCSTGLLVGAAIGWVRTSEARYRQVVGHIPLVLWSVRLGRAIDLLSRPVPERTAPRDARPAKLDVDILTEAEVVLVSPGASKILGVEPIALLGPLETWLEIVDSEDRPMVLAAISQLALQRQPVTYEYRLQRQVEGSPRPASAEPAPTVRWMRETLCPHYDTDGLLDGWDGIVEEITEARRLQQENRRVTGMLQALVANMPTGVFFVQGPTGQPILVNARARQLLGQREDVAAGLVHLSKVYRLHRADGTEYPSDELPVAKALRLGKTVTANDVVVHRPDGRRVPLFTWAAPVDLGNVGRAEGAVWVLEDLSALQQAEFARRETEARLRAVFETLAEGVIVQNQRGIIIEANPAATAILGISLERLVGQSWLAPDDGCLREDGTSCTADQHPDRLALQIKMPVRGVVLGIPRTGEGPRWLVVNSLPLPVGTAFSPNTRGASLVTTFADITKQREAQQSLVGTKERYQSLVESLPLLLLHFDARGAAVYVNPATQHITGYSVSDLAEPNAWLDVLEPADRPRGSLALQEASLGKDSSFEFRFRAKQGELKTGIALVHPHRADDHFPGSTWLILDLTRQRHLEEELLRVQRLGLKELSRLPITASESAEPRDGAADRTTTER